MKKAIVLSIFLFVSINFAIAQIENEIRTFVDSTELVVNNGRKFLVQKINTENYAKTKEIYDFLNSKTSNSNYKAFTYTEKLLITALIRDWGTILNLFKNYDAEKNYYTYPNAFSFQTILYENLEKKSDSLMIILNNSTLNQEDKGIIEIYLHLLKVRNIDEEYNKKLSNYLHLYKNSDYENFLKYYLPGVRLKNAFAFSIGPGIILPSGKLKSDFYSKALINMSLDVNIDKIYSSLFIEGGGIYSKNAFKVKVKEDTLNFYKDDNFSYFNVGLKAGYLLIRNKRFHFSPYLSISNFLTESTLYLNEKEGDEFEVVNSFCYGFGFSSEIKLYEFKYSNYYGPSMNYYLSVKLDGGYTIIAKHKNNYSGNVSFINLSFVWGFGDF